MKLRKILMGLAAVVGFTTAATAATPVAVWDGFDSLTSGDYTWTASAGTTVEDGVVTIGSDGGLTMANPTGLGDKAVTFIADIEGYDPTGAQMTIFDIGLGANRVNISNLSTSDRAVYQLWNAANGYGNVGQISTGKVRIITTYKGDTGTTTYVVGGNSADSGKLKSTGTAIAALGIGCYNGTQRVAAGMKVYRLAMFSAKLSESEAKAYQFPSEAALSKMYSNRLSTGGEQVEPGTYGAIEVEGDGYKATKFTEATKLSNTASGEEITGSYANIIKKPTGDTDIFAHTLMGWFKIDELPTAEGAAGATTIYAAKSHDGNYGGYKVAVGSDGKIYVGQCNNEGWNSEKGGPIVTTDGKIEAGKWFHLAISVTGRTDSTRKSTATVFFNGEAVETTSGTFGTNLNGNKCEYVRISGGIAAAGIYVDTNAIVYPSLAVEAATTYVEPYVAATEYSTTVNQDMTWSEIREVLLVDEEEFAENAQITLTMDGEYTITFDTTEALTGGLAFLKIEGVCQIALADELYEDGCWSKTIFTAPLIEAADATGVLKDGFKGGWTFGPTEIAIRAQNKEVISINIAGGSSGDATGKDSPPENLVTNAAVYYGLAPTVGSSWNNINKQWQGGAKTIEIQSPLAYDGETTIQRPTMSLSATGQNTWQAGLDNPFLRGYLDDPGGVTVMVHGVPYTKYDVIVYATSDRTDTGIAPVTVNGVQYTMVDGETVEGDTAWGKGMCNVPAFGDNAMIIRGCTNEQLTVSATRLGYTGADAGRATLCAVQVINKGEVVVTTDYVGVMSGDVEWTDGAEDENLESVGEPWVSGEYSTITITNMTSNGTFTFTQETEGLKFKVVSEEDCALTLDAASMVENGKLKTYDFTEAAGGVTIELPDEAFDLSTLPQIMGDYKFSGGLIIYDGVLPGAADQTLFKNPDVWTGTVWIKNQHIQNNATLKSCGNSNSIVRVTGVYGWMNNGDQGVATLELMDEDETIALEIDDSSQNWVYNYEKFIGDGTFKFATIAETPAAVSIADVSEFKGKLLSTDGWHKNKDTNTTARAIFVGGPATASTKSLISVADGATINSGCGWEAASVAFGATLTVKGSLGDAIVSNVTNEVPVLATKVTLDGEEGFYCLAYADNEVSVAEAVGFTVSPCDNATFAVAGAFAEGEGYYAAKGAPVKVTYTANDGYVFPDGSATLVVEATVTEEMEPIEAGETPVEAEAKIGTTYYLTLQDALNVGGDVTLLKDVAAEVTVPAGKTVNLDFGDFAITTTSRQAINNCGTLTIANGNITAQESAIVLWGNSVTTIKGGSYTANDNAVIAGSGNEGETNVVLNITGGTFTGNIESAGYIACGLYAPNSGTYTISGGTFNITDGCGVCARAGTTKIGSDVTFSVTGDTTGKVGDKATQVPCVDVYFDWSEPAYPGYAEGDTILAEDNTLTTDAEQEWSAEQTEGYYTLQVKSGPDVPSWIDPDDWESVQKYNTWALAYGVNDPNAAIKDAFLFNIENEESAVELAKERFVIHGITVDSDGTVTIEPPNEADVGVEFFNGTVIVRGSATVDGEYLLPQADPDARFFKAFLELISSN